MSRSSKIMSSRSRYCLLIDHSETVLRAKFPVATYSQAFDKIKFNSRGRFSLPIFGQKEFLEIRYANGLILVEVRIKFNFNRELRAHYAELFNMTRMKSQFQWGTNVLPSELRLELKKRGIQIPKIRRQGYRMFFKYVEDIAANIVGELYVREYPEKQEYRLDMGDGLQHVHVDWSRVKKVEHGISSGEGMLTFNDGDETLFLGCFWVSKPAKTMELAYAISEDQWGKGLVAEASQSVMDYCFKEFGLKRIQARCKVENQASAKVMQKIGINFEGTLKSSIFHRERYWDMHYYAKVIGQ